MAPAGAFAELTTVPPRVVKADMYVRPADETATRVGLEPSMGRLHSTSSLGNPALPEGSPDEHSTKASRGCHHLNSLHCVPAGHATVETTDPVVAKMANPVVACATTFVPS